MTIETKIYVKKEAGHFMGEWFEKGAEIILTEKQARYALLDGTISIKKTKKTTAPSPSKADEKG